MRMNDDRWSMNADTDASADADTDNTYTLAHSNASTDDTFDEICVFLAVRWQVRKDSAHVARQAEEEREKTAQKIWEKQRIEEKLSAQSLCKHLLRLSRPN